VTAATPRVMDCIDCHNRPTHIYDTPAAAVNLAMSTGRIDSTLPFIKRQAVAALAAAYQGTPAAGRGIDSALTAFYDSVYAGGAAAAQAGRVRAAVTEVQSLYAHNLFPEMKADWRAYPDNLGHKDFPGCFRCHDGNHTSADGRTIRHDCTSCHVILSQGPGGESVNVAAGGLAFQHPVDIGGAWQMMPCSGCHHGETP
jgi:hypothetical protein